MIPRQAFALKKYFRATHGSKTSNKEHTLASLGHAEKLRIQYSPCQTIPERIHFGQELAVSSPTLTCERSWDVLPDKPTWTEYAYRSNVFEHESGSSRESFSLACDREGLTRRSSDNNVCCSHIRAPIGFRDISKIRDIRVMVLQDG